MKWQLTICSKNLGRFKINKLTKIKVKKTKLLQSIARKMSLKRLRVNLRLKKYFTNIRDKVKVLMNLMQR